jgi:hypothetical protein
LKDLAEKSQNSNILWISLLSLNNNLLDLNLTLSVNFLSDNFVLPESEIKKIIVSLNSSRQERQQWAANVISYLCRDNSKDVSHPA